MYCLVQGRPETRSSVVGGKEALVLAQGQWKADQVVTAHGGEYGVCFCPTGASQGHISQEHDHFQADIRLADEEAVPEAEFPRGEMSHTIAERKMLGVIVPACCLARWLIHLITAD